MIRINNQSSFFDGAQYIEADTGKAFMFDEDDATWTELGGGS